MSRSNTLPRRRRRGRPPRRCKEWYGKPYRKKGEEEEKDGYSTNGNVFYFESLVNCVYKII